VDFATIDRKRLAARQGTSPKRARIDSRIGPVALRSGTSGGEPA
jgi:hypothetical protein